MSDAQFDKRIHGPLTQRRLLSSAYEKVHDALNSADLPESLEGSLSAAADWVAEVYWRLFDERIRSAWPAPTLDQGDGGVAENPTGYLIEWEQTVRDEFAADWPCCDVPATGWVELDVHGDVVDMSSACFRCEHGGGFDEFLLDLKSGRALPRDPAGFNLT